jgi:hypothetical protein
MFFQFIASVLIPVQSAVDMKCANGLQVVAMLAAYIPCLFLCIMDIVGLRYGLAGFFVLVVTGTGIVILPAGCENNCQSECCQEYAGRFSH